MKRRKTYKTEEAKQYDRRDPQAMERRLKELGYRGPEEYRDEASQYAW